MGCSNLVHLFTLVSSSAPILPGDGCGYGRGIDGKHSGQLGPHWRLGRGICGDQLNRFLPSWRRYAPLGGWQIRCKSPKSSLPGLYHDHLVWPKPNAIMELGND